MKTLPSILALCLFAGGCSKNDAGAVQRPNPEPPDSVATEAGEVDAKNAPMPLGNVDPEPTGSAPPADSKEPTPATGTTEATVAPRSPTPAPASSKSAPPARKRKKQRRSKSREPSDADGVYVDDM